MKKYLLTLVVLLASLPALFAQDPRSILKVRLSDNLPITVSVDNRFFNEANRVLTVNNVPAGRHRLKVYLANPNPSISARRMVYDGYVRLAPATSNYIVVDRISGRVRITTARRNEVETHDAYDPIDRSRYPQQGRRDDDRYDDKRYKDRDNDYKYKNKDNDRYDNDRYDNDDIYSRGNGQNDYERQDNGYRYEDRVDNRADGRDNQTATTRDVRGDDRYDNDRSGAGTGMSSRDMQDLKSRIASRITDTEKLKLMKSVLTGRGFTTEQTREMLSWLSFDSSRLDFAKWAYNNVSDRRNFWKLEDEFSFGSSKDEFNSIIKNNRY